MRYDEFQVVWHSHFVIFVAHIEAFSLFRSFSPCELSVFCVIASSSIEFIVPVSGKERKRVRLKQKIECSIRRWQQFITMVIGLRRLTI